MSRLRLAPRVFIANSGLLIVTVLAISVTLLFNSTSTLRDEAKDTAEQLATLIAGVYADIGEISIANVARTVDATLEDPMTAQATIAAHFVEAAEAALYDTSRVLSILASIAEETVLDEFWITDAAAFAYLTNVLDPAGVMVPFTFDPDPGKQPQASKFYSLLGTPMDAFAVITQPAQVREIDGKVYKYVGVNGVDHYRIVQVGNELVFGNQELLRQAHAGIRTDVSAVIEGNLGQHMRASATILDHFVAAAEDAGWTSAAIEEKMRRIIATTTIGEVRVAGIDGATVYSNISTSDTLARSMPYLEDLDRLLSDQWKDHPSRPHESDSSAYKYVTVARSHRDRMVQIGVPIEDSSGNLLYAVYQEEADILVQNGFPQALWLVNNDGEVVAAAQQMEHEGDTPANAWRLFASRADTSLLGDAMRNRAVRSVARLNLFSPEDRGLWAASPVINSGGIMIGGLLFFVNLEEIALAVRGEARKTALIALLLLTFTAIATFFGVRLLTGPIETIADAAREVETGAQPDYGLMQSVVARTDEIGSLARVFKDMTIQVFNREDVLESLVSERTEALQTTNDQLLQAQEEIDQDLEMAKVVQAALVREGSVDLKGFSACARMHPAQRVGGDFVDFLEPTDGRLFIVIGDVSGKGVAAALFMAASQASIKFAVAEQIKEISAVAEEANRRLCNQNPMSLFVTCVIAMVDLNAGDVDFVSAGHEPPYVLGAGGKRRGLEATGGLAMGVLHDFPYSSRNIRLEPGETLFLYTDGLTDMLNLDGELFGKERLEQSLDGVGTRTPEEIIDRVWSDISIFSAGTAAADDMTCLVLHRKKDQQPYV